MTYIRTAPTVALAILCITTIIAGIGTLIAVAPDVVPEIRKSQEETKLYEDGSYILNMGEFSIVGCAPLHPWNGEIVTGWCMDGGDNPLGYFKRGMWVWR